MSAFVFNGTSAKGKFVHILHRMGMELACKLESYSISINQPVIVLKEVGTHHRFVLFALDLGKVCIAAPTYEGSLAKAVAPVPKSAPSGEKELS
eukprot:950076-Pelagomonas_calceolata.AAC.2